MVFKENFIVAVKSNGQIMREDCPSGCNDKGTKTIYQNNTVNLQFGLEYSLLLKNKHSRKALVKVEIDGQDVLNGKRLIINPNSSTELEGFLKGSIAKNKFKFIKKTEEIVNHRGDRIDDGIIRVEYWFEKFVVRERFDTTYNLHYSSPYYGHPHPYRSFNAFSCNTTASMESVKCCATINQDEGITVKGSEINQQFNYGSTNELEEQSKVIALILKEYSSTGQLVKEPITVQTVLICTTCGRSNKSNNKLCTNRVTAVK